MTLVTVIIAAYNAESYLSTAVYSVINQTENRIEILIVDDASEDKTKVIANSLAQIDKRIRVIELPRNRGPGNARNVGMRAANGDWVAILDADDTFEPTRVKELVGMAINDDLDIVVDNLSVRVEGKSSYEMFEFPHIGLKRLSACDYISGSVGEKKRRIAFGYTKPVIRRSFLVSHGIFYPELRISEDFVFSVKTFISGAKWAIHSRAFYNYNVRRGSLTSKASAYDISNQIQAEDGLITKANALELEEIASALTKRKQNLHNTLAWMVFKEAVRRGSLAKAVNSFKGYQATRFIVIQCFTELIPFLLGRFTSKR